MLDLTAAYTDFYQLSMAEVYFRTGRAEEPAVFDYFFRHTPFGGGYTVLAGLGSLLDALESLRFRPEEIDFLAEQGFSADFLDYLRQFRFRGTVKAPPEGDLVFPLRPVLQVEADMVEAQLIETLLLNTLNFQSLVATKASRMQLVARGRRLVDFGLRRAQGAGAYHATRAAAIGGVAATSNVRAGMDFGIPVAGTMAHSLVQSYDDELSAFRDFARYRPHDCVLLVDTYDSLHSGLPNAITVAKEMEARGERLKGIRLDSGDLAYLAHKSREMLDQAGLSDVAIAASNKLDEHVIRSLMEQEAPIDLFGVGTRLITAQPDGALDGVYKLVHANGKPRVKLSENLAKITLPHRKQVYRVLDAGGQFEGAEAVALADEDPPARMMHPHEPGKSLDLRQRRLEPLLNTVMENGRRSAPAPPLTETAAFCRSQLARLPLAYKRFENPHLYKIGLSPRLYEARNDLVKAYRTPDRL